MGLIFALVPYSTDIISGATAIGKTKIESFNALKARSGESQRIRASRMPPVSARKSRTKNQLQIRMAPLYGEYTAQARQRQILRTLYGFKALLGERG